MMRKLSQQWQAAYSFYQSGVDVKEGVGVATTRGDRTKVSLLRKGGCSGERCL